MGEVPDRVERLRLPEGYGTPSKLLGWDGVAARLEGAAHYWLATVRPDGRPHVVPLDGIWLAGRWYFGGSPAAVKQRNLEANPQASLHLEDPGAAVIVEGRCAFEQPTTAVTEQLAAASKTKYGYAPPASSYLPGVWVLIPSRVMAWTDLTVDATRFVFT